MNFNNDTGLIDTILTLDTTETPAITDVGYQPNVLWVMGTGALTLPGGTTIQQPGNLSNPQVGTFAIGGMLRYNTSGFLEFYDDVSSSWQTLSYASGTVSSITGTANQITASSPTGAVTLSVPSDFRAPGSVTVATYATINPSNTVGNIGVGLTIKGNTADDLQDWILNNGNTAAKIDPNGNLYLSYGLGDASASLGTSGQVLSSTGTGTAWTSAPSVSGANITSGTIPNGALVNSSITVSNGTGIGVSGSPVSLGGTVTISNTGVTSFSTGTTGLSVNASTGAVTMSGTLNLVNGGTGYANPGSAGSIMYNNGTQIVNSAVSGVNQAFMSSGGTPFWTQVSSTLTTNQILQGGGTGAFTANSASFVGSPTFSGVTLQGTVTNSTDAATKAYVDAAVSNLSIHAACETVDIGAELASTATYTAGVAGGTPDAGTGVGATLSGTGVLPTIGGYLGLSLGDRVLIKEFTSTPTVFGGVTDVANGIYIVTAETPNWVLTRSPDFDNSIYGNASPGVFVFITEGTAAKTGWVETAIGTQITLPFPADVLKLSTDPVLWAQFSGAGTYLAGSGLTLSANTFDLNVDGTTTYVNGSNQAAVLSSSTIDQVLLSQGTGNTAAWGALPLNIAAAVSGTLPVTHGGTGNTSFTTDGVIYGGATLSATAAGVNGQVLVGNTGAAPSWSSSPSISGANITSSSIPNSALVNSSIALNADATSGTVSLGGTVTIDGTANRVATTVSGSSYAIDISASYVGQTSITTLGTVTTGTWHGAAVGATYGGTGIASYTTGDTLYASATNTLSTLPIGTAGQVLAVVAGAPAWISIATEAVTSFQTSLSGLTPSTATDGAVTLAGTLGVASGGTGAVTLTSNGVVFGNGTSPVGITAAGAQYNVLVVNGSGVPTLGTIDLSQSAAVGSSILSSTNGGTGVNNGSSSITLGGNLTTSGAFPLTLTVTGSTNVTLPTSGTLLTAADAVTSFTLATVTSPDAAVLTTTPATGTNVGSIASTVTFNTQAANQVFAGPTTGAAAQPSFRTLVYADVVGAALKLYAENPGTLVAPSSTGTNAIALGSAAVSSQYGGLVQASGEFATAGDAQAGTYIFRNTTTNTTPTELYLNGSSAEFVLPVDSVVTFSILFAARRTDATGFGGGFKVEGVAHRDVTAASVALIGSTSTTVIGRNPTGLSVSVTANTVTGGLKVNVTGIAASVYRWVAVMNTSEVTN